MASSKERFFLLKILVYFFIVLSFTGAQTAAQGNGNSGGQQGQLLAKLKFNDPEFSKQSYLNEMYKPKTAVEPNTMNIQKAWQKGYTGKNITICINDPTGVDYNNAELRRRFIHAASYNFDQNVTDVSPYLGRTRNRHGTAMAGLAAGEANNGVCIVGVAYEAYISSVKTLLSSQWSVGRDDIQIFADSFSFENQRNDIYSCSWGNMTLKQDNIAYVHQKIKDAIKRAAEKGRNGKGNIIVLSAGNGGMVNGTCSYDEYLSSIYTIGISVVTRENIASRQNMPCPAVSAVTYSRDGSLGMLQEDKMPSCALNNRCQTTGSSSAAAAVASGIMALVLQANPNLGWRDIQHLIARSSCSQFESVSWKRNNATYNKIRVSDQFGFGLLDADALTENAKHWTNVGKQLQCRTDSTKGERLGGVETLIKTFDMNLCVRGPPRITTLEHVVIIVSLRYTYRRNIEIELESPGGTKSVFLRSGRFMDDWMDINGLSMLSLHYWGENPQGTWTMRVRNVAPNKAHNGSLYRWSVIFYGTEVDPMTYNSITPSKIRMNEGNLTTMKPSILPKSTTSTTEMLMTGSTDTTLSPTTTKMNNVSNSSTTKTINQTVTISQESREPSTEMPMSGCLNTGANQEEKTNSKPWKSPGPMATFMVLSSVFNGITINLDKLAETVVMIVACKAKCVENITVMVAAVAFIVGSLVGLTATMFVMAGTLVGVVVAMIFIVSALIWLVARFMKIDMGKPFKVVFAVITIVGAIVGVVVAVVATLEEDVAVILIIEVGTLATVVIRAMFIVMKTLATVVVAAITVTGIMAAVLVAALGRLKNVVVTVVIIVAVTLTVLAGAVITMLVIKWPQKKRREDGAGEDVHSKDTTLSNFDQASH